MPLQIFFGDDEHTAVDGPYARLMKARKWLYLSSICAGILHLGLYSETASAKVQSVVKLPADILAVSVGIGLAYMLAQYLLLLGQLMFAYDIVLKERFLSRRAAEMTVASSQVRDARKRLRVLRSRDGQSGGARISVEDDIAEAQADLDEATAARAELRGLDASTRKAYRRFEFAVDALRLMPPIVLAAWALFGLLHPR